MKALLLSRVSEANQSSPFRKDDTFLDDACTPSDRGNVGPHLSAEVRQQAIERAGAAMEAAYARFKQTYRAADLDRAHYHMRQMLTLAGVAHE